jgi:hypothetical protein
MRAKTWFCIVGNNWHAIAIGVGICVLSSIFGAWAAEYDGSLQRVAAISTPNAKGSPSGDLRQWIKSKKKRRCSIANKRTRVKQCQICTVLEKGRLRCPVRRPPPGGSIFDPIGDGHCDPGCEFTGQDCECSDPDGNGDGN